jgi:hypothetical protein
MWDSTELHPPFTAHIMSLLGQSTLKDAPTCGSRAYRSTYVWQNLMPQSVLEAEHARLPKPTSPVEAAHEVARLTTWSPRPTPPAGKGMSHNEGLPPRKPLPHVGTHPDTSPFWVHNGIPGKGLLYDSNLPSTPSLEVREALMGFRVGATDALGISIAHGVYLLGKSTDLNSISRTISTIKANISAKEPVLPGIIPHDQRNGGYTSFQTLPSMEDRHNLPYGGVSGFPRTPNTPPTPRQWTPKYIPDYWLYTYGSDIKGNRRLGAAVVHVPTRTTICIDTGGTDETRTITWAELVAIHTALLHSPHTKELGFL